MWKFPGEFIRGRPSMRYLPGRKSIGKDNDAAISVEQLKKICKKRDRIF